MRAVLFVVLLATVAADARSDGLPWTHVRAQSPVTRDFLEVATERSAFVRGQMDELEGSDVVVLLTLSSEPAMRGRRPHMAFVSASAGLRYVLVRVYWMAQPPVAYVPVLAHELQHALELAAAPEVCDEETYARLFARIGYPAGPHMFETDAAREAQERVREELTVRAGR